MVATEPRRQKVCSACRKQGCASLLIPGARNDQPEPVWFALLVLVCASWHTPNADARPLAALRVERGIFVSAPSHLTASHTLGSSPDGAIYRPWSRVSCSAFHLMSFAQPEGCSGLVN